MMGGEVHGTGRLFVRSAGAGFGVVVALALVMGSESIALSGLSEAAVPIGVGLVLALWLGYRIQPGSGSGGRGSARIQALLHSTLDSTNDGIVAVDLEGRVVSYNQRFLEMWSLDPADLATKRHAALEEVHVQLTDPEAFLTRVRELHAAPEQSATDILEFRDGRIYHRATQPHRLDHRIVGRVWSFRDITEQRRTETALAESERRFRRMATNVPGVIFQFYVRRDSTLWFTYLSEGCQALLGVTPPAFPWRADSLVDRIHPTDMSLLRSAVRDATQRMEAWSWEGRVTLAEGAERWLRAASRPTRHADGKVTWDGLLMDVSEEKAAVGALHRREEQLAEAQEIAHIGSWDWDLVTGVTVISEEHWRIFGYEPGAVEWSFEQYIASIHPDDRERVQTQLERSLVSGAATCLDYRIIRPDGEQRFVTSRGKVAKDSYGAPLRVVGTVQDVTGLKHAAAALEKRVRAEQALTQAARILSSSSCSDLTEVLQRIGAAIGADRAYLFQHRAEGDAVLMDNTHEWCADGIASAIADLQGIDTAAVPWWHDQLECSPSVVLQTLDALPASATLERHLLEMHGVRATVAVPLTDSRLGLIGFIGFDRVRIGASWSEEDVRVLQTTAEMLVAHFSRVKAEKEVERREGILQAVSFAAERFLRTPDWEAGLDEALALIGGAAGVSRTYLFQTQPGDGTDILVRLRAEWVADGVEPQMPARGLVSSSLVDLRLGRWEELFRNREMLQGTVSELPEYERTCLTGQGIQSILQIPIYVGDEWWGTLGIDDCLHERAWSATEVEALRTAAGMIAAAVQRKRSEEALRESEERFRQMAENMREVFFMVSANGRELIYLSPSYEVVWGRDRSNPQAFVESILPEDRHIVFADMELSRTGKGDPLRFVEYRISRPDGSIRWIRHRSFQVLDSDGNPYRVTGVCSDITEQKQLEEELRRANRVEAMGHLAAGIAHEINTPIQYVGDNLRFLNESYADLERAVDAYQRLLIDAKAGAVTGERISSVEAVIHQADLEYLLTEAPRASAQALDGVRRVAEIVRAMKEFSHPGTGMKVPTDLNQAIVSTTTVARNEWKYVAELVTRLDDSLPLVPCLPGELNQAILNLVVNAAHAIGERQHAEESDSTGTITISTAAKGPWVEIRISDTGTGIPADIRSRIFDPFFTTKEVGRGTGQGLTFVHTIVVEKHGGTISFDTEVGVGTTFVVRLPSLSDTPQISAAA